jgi:nitrite reductase (NADH) small subunit
MKKDSNKIRYFAGNRSEYTQFERKVFELGGSEIGIFRHNDEFFAYENHCPHMGGPVCQGKIVNRVIELIDENKQSRGMKYDGDSRHVVCPWHGYEYDVRTGIHAGNPRIRLRRYQIDIATNGDIYVIGS